MPQRIHKIPRVFVWCSFSCEVILFYISYQVCTGINTSNPHLLLLQVGKQNMAIAWALPAWTIAVSEQTFVTFSLACYFNWPTQNWYLSLRQIGAASRVNEAHKAFQKAHFGMAHFGMCLVNLWDVLGWGGGGYHRSISKSLSGPWGIVTARPCFGQG